MRDYATTRPRPGMLALLSRAVRAALFTSCKAVSIQFSAPWKSRGGTSC